LHLYFRPQKVDWVSNSALGPGLMTYQLWLWLKFLRNIHLFAWYTFTTRVFLKV